MPEEVCFGFIEKYLTEQKALTAETKDIEAKLKETETEKQSVDGFYTEYKSIYRCAETDARDVL